MLFVCLRISYKICLKIYLEIYLAEKYIMNLMVSQNLRRAHLLEVGMTEIPGDHEILSIVRHVGLHVDFSSMKSSLGL